MTVVPRRALRGMFPAAAVLASAVGIAYLGAVSYFGDRGLVTDVAAQHAVVARRASDAVGAELRAALSAAEAALAPVADGDPGLDPWRDPRDPAGSSDGSAVGALGAAHPIASQPFVLTGEGRLLHPSPEPGGDGLEAAPDQEFLTLLSGRARRDPERAAALRLARRQEIGMCPTVGVDRAAPAAARCQPTPRGLSEARRAYARLARHRDTGADALLGMARLERAAARPAQAAAFYRELAYRFGDSVDVDGTSYAVLGALGLAEVEPAAQPLIDLMRQIGSGRAVVARAARPVFLDRVRGLLDDRALDPAQRAQVAALDRARAGEAEAARLVLRLADDLGPMARTADAEPRGRPSQGAPGHSLVYRRLVDGQVVGLVVEAAALGRVASAAVPAREREVGVRAAVVSVGEVPEGGASRSLASASLGPLLPHLAVALVQDRSRPDALAEMVSDRSRRHLAWTGGLVAVLVLGLFATIRGAARERELARLKSDLVSTVSHELKTPLTSIRMFAEMLQQGVAGDDRERERRYHEIIVAESERLGLLIANLLDYAQIERGTRRYLRRPQLAADVAREAVATFARLREGAGQEVSLEVDEDAAGAELVLDREVTVQALLNLLSNAVKYGGDGQAVEVRVSRRGEDRIALAVRDRGPGIPRAEQARIFREFYRAQAAYAAGVEGTGLGLALVKRHVEAQGGAVELESQVGQGATFALVFGAPGAEERA